MNEGNDKRAADRRDGGDRRSASRRDVDEVARSEAEAKRVVAEYRRALRDYTQLTRHRLANPLTAITGGIATLRDLDTQLDPATRMQILDAMAETAERLERAVLHPELVSDAERELQPLPDLDGTGLSELLTVDAVKAEQHARAVNAKMLEQIGGAAGGSVEFFCECWAIECAETMTLPLRDYFAIHDRDDQFVILPEHNLPTVEHVVERCPDWWVVRKFAAAMDAARDG